MLQVNDFRETKIYQEAFEEGREETKEAIAKRLLAKKRPLAEIADVTGLSVAALKQLKKKPRK